MENHIELQRIIENYRELLIEFRIAKFHMTKKSSEKCTKSDGEQVSNNS